MEFNLNNPDEARSYLSDYFQNTMNRVYYRDYIVNKLAGDFACAIAQRVRELELEAESLRVRPSINFAEALTAQLIESGAINYQETHVTLNLDQDQIDRTVTVTVQYGDKPSPHELLIEKQKELEVANRKLKKALELLSSNGILYSI